MGRHVRKVQEVLKTNPGKSFSFGYRDRRGVVTTCTVTPVCLLQFKGRAALLALWEPSLNEVKFFYLDRIQAIRPLGSGMPRKELDVLRIAPMGPVSIQSFVTQQRGEEDE